MSSHSRVSLGVLAACALLSAAPGPAQADDAAPAAAGNGLRFDGFGTLGAEHASVPHGWSFQRDASQPLNDGGTRYDTDSRLGLQLSQAFGTRLDATAQWLLRHRVASSQPIDSLEWGFIAWHATPAVDLRIGRVNPDIFLLSDQRSIGFSQPWVRPNVEFYGLLPLYAIDGVDLAWNWRSGEAHWRAKVFGGTGHTRTPNPASGDSGDIDFRIRRLFGLVLSREAEGLLVRATVAHYRGSFALGSESQQAVDAIEGLAQANLPGVSAEAAQMLGAAGARSMGIWYLTLSSRYDSPAWLASGELMHSISELTYTGATAAYLSVGRRFGPLTVFTMAGKARSNRPVQATPQWSSELTPLLGPAAGAQAQVLAQGITELTNAMRVDQHTLSLGLRWDLHPRAALKLQWDHTQVRADGSVLWAHATPDAARAEVISAVLDFVF